MKKIYLLLFLLLFIPIRANALEPNYNIDGLYINAEVLGNGDMLVKEQIVMNGSFNGYIRDLYYKGNYSLYDASSIELRKVCSAPQSNGSGYSDITAATLICFNQVGTGTPGDIYVYERTDATDHVTLTMFNYTENGSKIFYIEYLLKDVVVIHNDVAELYWTFIGQNFDDDIANVKIEVDLPSAVSDLRVWAHGPLEGNIKRKENKRIVATINNLYANNLVDIRATFDKEVVPSGTKLSNKDSFSSIVKEEEVRADEANRQRTIASFVYYGMISLNIIWIACAVALAIYTYRKYDKEHKSDFKLEYHREFPAEYGPEVVEYLMKKNITSLSLSAKILDIIRKKGFAIREEETKHGKTEYILVKQNDAAKLTTEEAYIIDWLVNDCGNGLEVSLNQIEKTSQNLTTAKDFIKKYDKWVTLSKMNAVREELYEDNLGFKIKGVSVAILGCILFMISIAIALEPPIIIMTLIPAVLLLVYILTFTRRTIKGNDHFVKWKAFKKFLKDFGRFDEKELPEVVLWEKYLVYATVFGLADKVAKTMEVKIQNMGVDVGMPLYSHIYLNRYFTNNLVNTVNVARTSSMSKIAQSQSSSGSGFGGGFSGGGGFGGGGTGGGGGGF